MSDNIQDHRVGDDRIAFKISPTADSVCIRWLCRDQDFAFDCIAVPSVPVSTAHSLPCGGNYRSKQRANQIATNGNHTIHPFYYLVLVRLRSRSIANRDEPWQRQPIFPF